MGWFHPEGGSGRVSTTLLAYPQPWVTLLVLGPVFFGMADGCFRQNKQPAPPTPKPMLVEPAMTPPAHLEHRMECDEFETLTVSCLHGGECVAVEDYMGRTATCHCPAEYWGPRCAEFKPIFEILGVRQGRVRTAHIAAGVSCCIIVIFIVLLVIYVWLRKRNRNMNKAAKSRTAAQEEGTALALNGMGGSDREKADIPVNGNTEHGIRLDVEGYDPDDDYSDEKQPMNSTEYGVDTVDSMAEDKV